MDAVIVKDYERVDDLHRNGYKIIQDPKKFCFGQDAVLLSSFAKAYKNERVLDLGTGTGIIPILMEAKTKAAYFCGIDIQPESVEMATRSVRMNGLSDKIEILYGDLKNAVALFGLSSFDVITTNPPYMNHGGGAVNEYSPKAIARHELLCNLQEVVTASAGLLKPNGRFYMVHRPHRLTEILVLLEKHRLEPKVLRFVHPRIEKEPAMVLIEAVRGAKAMVKVLPPLVIYGSNNQYTEEVHRMYYE